MLLLLLLLLYLMPPAVQMCAAGCSPVRQQKRSCWQCTALAQWLQLLLTCMLLLLLELMLFLL
jgi:hypothetical protein